MEYQETGNKIPIKTSDLIKFIQKQLSDYEMSVSKTKTIGKYNPYTEPIIFKTKNGNTIMVPEEIKKYAINLWYKENGINVPVMMQESQLENIDRSESLVNFDNTESSSVNYIKIFIVVLVCILFIYYFVK